jgi:protoporphyrin/coproporphyrin ferrochelatase
VSRVAVVLFNLGGPDGPAAVEPFLFNLFNDKAIIGAPQPVRYLLARLISRRRAPIARAIYARIGGGSPILANTNAQATALESRLASRAPETTWRVFVSMRYWHAFADATAAAVKAFAPERILLVPLYPQFSTTTSESSLADWQRAAAKAGIEGGARAACCYPRSAGFVAAVADLTRRALAAFPGGRAPRLLFSAHGLPKKVIGRGDPYQWQVEQSVAAVVQALARPDLDHVVCYQSRVGPLEWIGPSTEAEIARAGADKVPVLVVPIAFVSEHSETLVELDIEYRHLAEAKGVPGFARVPTVGTHPAFIDGLAETALWLRGQEQGRCHNGADGPACPNAFRRCGLRGRP